MCTVKHSWLWQWFGALIFFFLLLFLMAVFLWAAEIWNQIRAIYHGKAAQSYSITWVTQFLVSNSWIFSFFANFVNTWTRTHAHVNTIKFNGAKPNKMREKKKTETMCSKRMKTEKKNKEKRNKNYRKFHPNTCTWVTAYIWCYGIEAILRAM